MPACRHGICHLDRHWHCGHSALRHRPVRRVPSTRLRFIRHQSSSASSAWLVARRHELPIHGPRPRHGSSPIQLGPICAVAVRGSTQRPDDQNEHSEKLWGHADPSANRSVCWRRPRVGGKMETMRTDPIAISCPAGWLRPDHGRRILYGLPDHPLPAPELHLPGLRRGPRFPRWSASSISGRATKGKLFFLVTDGAQALITPAEVRLIADEFRMRRRRCRHNGAGVPNSASSGNGELPSRARMHRLTRPSSEAHARRRVLDRGGGGRRRLP